MNEDKYLLKIIRYASESNSAICQIIGKYDSIVGNEILFDKDIILTDFGKSEKVFVPKLDPSKYQANDFIQVSIMDIFPEVENKYPRVHYGSVKVIKYCYFIELDHIQINDLSIDYKALQLQIIPLSDYLEKAFYISDGRMTYGRFKIENNKVIAEIGLEVRSYKTSQFIKITHPDPGLKMVSVVIKSADSACAIYDYSSDSQVIDYTKGLIERSKLDNETRGYINIIKKMLPEKAQGVLEINRIRRTQTLLDSVILKYDEFLKLRNNVGFWKCVFDNSIDSFEAKLKEEYLVSHKEVLEKDLIDIHNNIKLRIDELNRKNEKLISLEHLLVEKRRQFDDLNTQVDIIRERKEELLIMLSVRNDLVEKSAGEYGSYYDIQNSRNNKFEYFSTLKEIVDEIEDIVGCDKFPENMESGIRSVVINLKNSNFFICKKVIEILEFLHAFGNCKIFLTNVEIDWIKFSKLSNNGLMAAIEAAYATPEIGVFLLLQDFNLASPECYAKPLLDISKGIRHKFPNESKDWPNNLRIVFIPLEVHSDDFGFDINEKTFDNWIKLDFPKLEYSKFNLNKAVNFELLKI